SGGQRVLGLGVDHMTGITETVGAGAAEAVRIHSCCLRGEVSANPQGSSSQLIRYLECQQVYIAPEADKQGIGIFQQGRDHHVIPPVAVEIEQLTAQVIY